MRVYLPILAAFLGVVLPQVVAAPVYQLTALPMESPRFLADDGTVCGVRGSRGMVWAPSGESTTISPPSGYYNVWATVIDAAGDVYGTAHNNYPPYSASAFRWNSTDGVEILGLGPLLLNDVNSSGVFVAESGRFAPYQTYHGYTWSPATGLQQLPTLAGDTDCIAEAINDGAITVGWSWSASTSRIPVSWKAGGSPHNFPLLPGTTTGRAHGVNNSCVAVGDCGTSAVRWLPDGTAEALVTPLPVSAALRVNDAGLVVGKAAESSSSAYRAVLWETNGQCHFLDDLVDASGVGWTLQDTAWINSGGQIIGWGLDPSGTKAGFLLTPVPEPATAIALVALWLIRPRPRN